ncbi:MAG TPA: 2OG-Fe(II) oxygenase [Steroidobacteraceae bacterium]|nr:2OG-Fe(II) oxygenase [Steroidobacteraceae bacterium]
MTTTRERALDASWKAWLQENLARGCDRPELVQILLTNGFSLSSIKQNMGDAFPLDTPPQDPLQPPRLVRHPPPKLQKVPTDALDIYTLDDFLSANECDRLVALINHHLRPSTVTIEGTDQSFRISQTCDLSLLRSPTAARCDEKICRTLGIRPEYSEGIQAQRYDVGGQFKAHTDYFEPGTPEFAKYGGARGNRTWTFMVYLNEGMVGGGTKFFAIDHTFLPKKGRAVIWNNLNPDGTVNEATLHSGEPVTAGHKIIITKWFRERGSGPMFYED